MMDPKQIAVDDLRRGMAESPEARDYITTYMLALAAGLLAEAYGVEAAIARLRREAEALAEDFATPPGAEVH